MNLLPNTASASPLVMGSRIDHHHLNVERDLAHATNGLLHCRMLIINRHKRERGCALVAGFVIVADYPALGPTARPI